MTTHAVHCFQYVDCDIPPGMTIAAWKREKACPARASGLRRLLARTRLA